MDNLNFIPDPEPNEMDEKTRAWLCAPLTPPLEPYDWGPEGEPEGVPVRYVLSSGWMMLEDDT